MTVYVLRGYIENVANLGTIQYKLFLKKFNIHRKKMEDYKKRALKFTDQNQGRWRWT